MFCSVVATSRRSLYARPGVHKASEFDHCIALLYGSNEQHGVLTSCCAFFFFFFLKKKKYAL